MKNYYGIAFFSPKRRWQKTVMRMKLLSMLMLVGVLQLSASVKGQNAELSMNMHDVSLVDFFAEIKSQTDYEFLYNHDLVMSKETVDVEVNQGDLRDLLENILHERGLGFELDDNVIVISERAYIAPIKTKEQENERVHGRVTDKDGNGLPGVSVVLKGTFIGVTTDIKGKYSLLVSSKEAKLIFSFVGMKTIEIEIADKNIIDVVLLEVAEGLEEVAITGFRRIKKTDVTSAITSLKASEILVPGVNTIDNLLKGRVPGLMVLENTGQIGAAPKVRIRGASTVLGSREPLWVVDGIVQTDPVDIDPSRINDLDFVNLLGNAISGLNPEDIEQIDVLKDASSTALYGARAANGVIVITTKQGKEGDMVVSFSHNTTFRQRPRYSDKSINMMNSKERIDFSREIMLKKISFPMAINTDFGYEGALLRLYNGDISYDEFHEEVSLYESVNTDWFDLLTQNSVSSSNTVSLSGGSKNIKYYSSLGYMDENGTIKGDENKRYTAVLNLSANYDKFSMFFGIKANSSERNYTPDELDILRYAYGTSRAIPAFNKDKSLWFYSKSSSGKIGDNYDYNAIHEMENSYDEITNNTIGVNMRFQYKFNENFNISQTIAYSTSHNDREKFFNENTHYAASLRGSEYGMDAPSDSEMPIGSELRISNSKSQNWTMKTQANHKIEINKDHIISVLAGFEIRSQSYLGKSQTHRGYFPERGRTFAKIDMSKYATYADWYESSSEGKGLITDNINNNMSVYANVAYSYKNIYYLNVNSRTDASNKFGNKNNSKFSPVWSVSGRFNAKEALFKNADWVNLFAIKSSFGYQGNTISTQSPELIIRKGEWNDRFSSFQSEIKNYPNSKLKWEKTRSYNVSTDFSLFNNKLRGTVSYFYKKTTDAFLNKKVASINGVEEYVTNMGTLTNKGLELSFNLSPVKRRNIGGFYWDFNPQLGQVINKLITKATNKYTDPTNGQAEVSYKNYLNGSAFIEGKPLNSFYSYKFTGLDPDYGHPTFANVSEEDGERYTNMDYEDVMMEILDYSGSRVPTIQGGVNNTIGYKNFTMSFSFDYSIGSKIRLFKLYNNLNEYSSSAAPFPQDNVRKEFTRRWRNPGDETHTNIPGLIQGLKYNNLQYPWWGASTGSNKMNIAKNVWQMYDSSDIRVVSGNYLRLSSVAFRYLINDNICKKFHLRSAHLGLSATNLFTICSSKLKGQDVTQSGDSNQMNLSSVPTYTLSFNVSF
jgi:TonB-linked SusC/RagA family outer membrane protein